MKREPQDMGDIQVVAVPQSSLDNSWGIYQRISQLTVHLSHDPERGLVRVSEESPVGES